MKTIIEFDEKFEAIVAMKSMDVYLAIDELRETIRSHLKHGTPLTMDNVYDAIIDITRITGEE